MKRSDIYRLDPTLASILGQLNVLRTERMTLEDRAEITLGCLMNLASAICDTVTDWSQPRPVMPLSSWQAWCAAHELVKGVADGMGDVAWEHACKDLRTDLEYGYAAYRDDIA
ncbi:hypothetical protein [Erwinia amylovora]|uniref:hypothetical protein n=1 Tax=Erwinia amylovora TaxID=552 RepID=UPI0020BEC4C2|nr:hypothetical protein [Erwinia amylovora]MCK8417583.1 hypothetical protein [Erwinia amylovora]